MSFDEIKQAFDPLLDSHSAMDSETSLGSFDISRRLASGISLLPTLTKSKWLSEPRAQSEKVAIIRYFYCFRIQFGMSGKRSPVTRSGHGSFHFLLNRVIPAITVLFRSYRVCCRINTQYIGFLRRLVEVDPISSNNRVWMPLPAGANIRSSSQSKVSTIFPEPEPEPPEVVG